MIRRPEACAQPMGSEERDVLHDGLAGAVVGDEELELERPRRLERDSSTDLVREAAPAKRVDGRLRIRRPSAGGCLARATTPSRARERERCDEPPALDPTTR